MSSAYTDDPRVVDNSDGTFTLPNPGDHQGDWQIMPATSGGYVVRNDDHTVTCEGDRYNQRAKLFDTADEAIGWLAGEPVTSQATDEPSGDRADAPAPDGVETFMDAWSDAFTEADADGRGDELFGRVVDSMLGGHHERTSDAADTDDADGM